MEFNLNIGSFETENKVIEIDEELLYDVIIIGGGPAALTSAVYCMRKGIKTAIITKNIGGQVMDTSWVENYMGYKYIEGLELVEKFKEQVKQFEIGYKEDAIVLKVEAEGEIKKVTTDDGKSYKAKSIIVSTGKSSKKLNVPGEEKYRGRGVAYCATCDAPLFARKEVIVVGGGNSGVESAIDLAKIAKKVYLVQFLDKLTADKILIDRLLEYKNVEILTGHEITEILGDQFVDRVTVKNRKTDNTYEITAQGVFVEIGLIPNSGFIKEMVKLNKDGEIIVDCLCRTTSPGVFAAGDVTSVPFKQIIIATGEGAKAALSVCEYLLTEIK